MKILSLVAFMVTFTVVANLLLKQGAMAPEKDKLFFGYYSWKTVIGFGAFAVAGLAYAALMRWVPLNVATSFAALQFVAVILASAVILSEPIPVLRWLGIALITAGVVLVGSSVDKNSAQSQSAKPGVTLDG